MQTGTVMTQIKEGGGMESATHSLTPLSAVDIEVKTVFAGGMLGDGDPINPPLGQCPLGITCHGNLDFLLNFVMCS